MASGGMDWAYRMIAAHKLDALAGMIVLHLGWRDHPRYRTDRAIARELHRSRAAVQAATAKLVALGIIQRDGKGLSWVACETVAIVRGDASAIEPDAAVRDDRPRTAPREGRPRERAGPERGPGGGPERGPQTAPREGHIEKEKKEKGPAALSSVSEKGRRGGRGVSRPVDASALSPFQRARVLSGQSVVLAGALVEPGTPRALALCQALRGQSAMEGARNGCA